MRITFLGTRGYIEESSPLHRMHSALLLEHAHTRLLLDAGQTWAGKLARVAPDWIAITHAHPDHAWGLARGAACPVYVTSTTRRILRAAPAMRGNSTAPALDFRIFRTNKPFLLGPFSVLAYRVIHSLRAPAVGFKIRVDGTTLMYNPDVISIPGAARILRGVDVYVGDGATLTRPLVRRHGNRLFGHTTVRAQLNWCARYAIARAFIVHCGKQLVTMKPSKLEAAVAALAAGRLAVSVAHDGMRVSI